MSIYEAARAELNRATTLSLSGKRKMREIARALDDSDFETARFVVNEGGGAAFTLAERKMLLRILGAEDSDDAETEANIKDKEKTRKRINRAPGISNSKRQDFRKFMKKAADNFPASGGGGSTLLTGLEAWWELDEASGDRADSTAAGITLTEGGTVGTTTGKTSTLASVTTGGTSAKLENTTFFEPDDDDFTISGWMNLSSATANNFILGNHDFSNGYYFGTLNAGNDTVEFEVRGTRVDSAITTGSWIHFVLYHDSVNDQIGMILDDGTPITVAHTTGANTGASAFNGIQLHNLYTGAFSGGVALNAVAVHSRVLTAAEITESYNSGDGLRHADL
jgi:hypothetical protein